jgi:hypothetical protein
MVFAFVPLIALLDGVKKPKEFRFFSTFTKSVAGSEVFPLIIAVSDSAFLFCGISLRFFFKKTATTKEEADWLLCAVVVV